MEIQVSDELVLWVARYGRYSLELRYSDGGGSVLLSLGEAEALAEKLLEVVNQKTGKLLMIEDWS